MVASTPRLIIALMRSLCLTSIFSASSFSVPPSVRVIFRNTLGTAGLRASTILGSGIACSFTSAAVGRGFLPTPLGRGFASGRRHGTVLIGAAGRGGAGIGFLGGGGGGRPGGGG